MTVFLVTGCASGIGSELAGAIAARGDRLVATDRNLDGLNALAQSASWPTHTTSTRALDVTDPSAWRDVLSHTQERFGAIDVLINVAGVLRPGWVHECADDDVDLHFDVNVKGVVHGMRYAARAMVERGSGHIINIASMAALAPIPGIALYCASKYAVRAYSLAAAQELRSHGVAVTVVCPDAVQTPMLELQRDYEEAAMTFSGPRVLTALEVVDAILGPVLKQRPLELFVPRSRGWLARAADLFPTAALRIGPLLTRAGRKKQQHRDS